MAMIDEEKRAFLEKVFQVPARLRIMTVLAARKRATFSELVDELNLTRGNLSIHMKQLSENGYVTMDKAFVSNRPQTTYVITDKGTEEFSRYIDILESIIAEVRRGGSR
jgi:DNA-binding MarR family transcriptional regulator